MKLLPGFALRGEMPKKKNKRHDDSWEDDVEAIVEANKTLEAKESSSSRLDALFAEAIARGKASDGEYDAATDQLASGTKTEDELIAFYFPNAASAADAEQDSATKAVRAQYDSQEAGVQAETRRHTTRDARRRTAKRTHT